MRIAEIYRKTKETDIHIAVNLDGNGSWEGSSGLGFLDHMLDALARHSRIDLRVSCTGDWQVDGHHTVEDIGIVLGSAIKKALGEGRGIVRYGSSLLPMDEALVLVALDISGRSHLQYEVAIPAPKVGDFDTELAREFFYAIARSAQMTLHMKQLAGENSHHILEAVFKAFARALREACAIDAAAAQEIPSTKGSL